MLPDKERIIALHRQISKEASTLHEKKLQLSRDSKNASSQEQAQALEAEAKEVHSRYRHMRLHLDEMMMWMEQRRVGIQEEQADVYGERIRSTEESLAQIQRKNGDLANLYRRKIELLNLLQLSVLIENTESAALVYAYLEVEEQILQKLGMKEYHPKIYS